MLVSWKWLSRYVDLPMSVAELESRLAMAGLNHESTTRVDDDYLIDLEITSNRGDCLGHLGVAREISVLFDLPLRKPIVEPTTPSSDAGLMTSVLNEFPEACPRYTARLIRGVRIGPSPAWLAESLQRIGIGSVNNVVDATNYVMFECGQPLHAFDFDRLAENRIVVRPAVAGETITAIDHRSYSLDPSMCVIADASRAVAVAGVMGGEQSEVDEATENLLIEAALFTPLSIRRTARKLKLFSPSSFRFERRTDPHQLDWASRRVCELILGIAGGELIGGSVDTAPEIPLPPTISLRFAKLNRLLGIEIDRDVVLRILTALGCEAVGESSGQVEWQPPSWRHDLSREVDLIEEVARVHGYDRIPEDHPIVVTPSSKRPFDVAIEKVRGVLVGAGISEAMTPSVVTEKVDAMLSPWTELPALSTQVAMLEGAKRLRRSLLASLLQSRAFNWTSSGTPADLFEIAHIYLPGEQADDLPAEQYTLGMIGGLDFFVLKGVVDEIGIRLGLPWPLRYLVPSEPKAERWSGFDPGRLVEIHGGDEPLGYLGVISPRLAKTLKLPGETTAAELSLVGLLKHAVLVPAQQAISPFPSIQRDLNLILAESIRWADLEAAVRAAAGPELAAVTYRETYRDPAKDGPDRKRILLALSLQKRDATLTGAEADATVAAILASCEQAVGAKLLS
ncbi:MAG: phenylalanine--tRNA ligase subunit beta [Planctomycetaceae bacterium]|nr:MAG: phenylalanine--tRNA ligase subunit beta [Planctomycetaceae bacterium]